MNLPRNVRLLKFRWVPPEGQWIRNHHDCLHLPSYEAMGSSEEGDYPSGRRPPGSGMTSSAGVSPEHGDASHEPVFRGTRNWSQQSRRFGSWRIDHRT